MARELTAWVDSKGEVFASAVTLTPKATRPDSATRTYNVVVGKSSFDIAIASRRDKSGDDAVIRLAAENQYENDELLKTSPVR